LTLQPDTAPVAVGDAFSATEDIPRTVTIPGALGSGVLANDTDAENDSLTAVGVSTLIPATQGTISLGTNGSFTYFPAADFSGTVSFTYRANDGQLLSANTATVTITLVPVNDAPKAVGDNYTVSEDNTLVAAAPGVLINDSDVDNDPLTVQLQSLPAHTLS